MTQILSSLAVRVWWVPVFAVAVATASLTVGADTGDLSFFVHAADDLFSAGWAHVYAKPDLQIGPVQLLLLALADALAGALSLSTFTLLAFAVPLGVTALFLVVVRRLLGGRRPLVLMAAGLVFAGLGLPAAAYVDGHMAQVVVPLLWLLAGLKAREGHVASAGALVGISAGFELWGMLGVVVLLLAPRLRDAVAGVAVQLVVAASLFAPFAIAGELRMFHYHWVVNGDTLLSLFVEPGTGFTWWMRLAQAATALAVAAGLVWPLRRTLHAVWLGPLLVIAVRLALDPVRYPWYWLALETIAVVGAVELLTRERARRLRQAERLSSSSARAPALHARRP
ncbi:MAG TPA: hypothetical protein VKB07_04735 [Gaiellaceae bacterium]|nr:hypothetical protein [Gaiellaceae bacterium]